VRSRNEAVLQVVLVRRALLRDLRVLSGDLLLFGWRL